MADIIEFRQQSAPEPTRRCSREPQHAEIVIFPGIRHERWEEPREDQIAKVQERARRDMLQLVE